MFSGISIAKEVDGVGDKWSGNTTMVSVQALLDAFLNMSLKSTCFIDEILPPPSPGKKQNCSSWD
jgi:hypothetical protein